MNYYATPKYSDGDIRHWKYIKKYRVNGKWRYVYADKKTHADIEFSQTASQKQAKYSSEAYARGENAQGELLGNASKKNEEKYNALVKDNLLSSTVVGKLTTRGKMFVKSLLARGI